MVTANGFGRNGLQTWIVQRISAVILVAYTILLLSIWAYLPVQTVAAWQGIFASIAMRYATLVVLLALVLHSWIGLWIVITDYLHNPWLRLSAELLVYVALFLYMLWGVQLLWR